MLKYKVDFKNLLISKLQPEEGFQPKSIDLLSREKYSFVQHSPEFEEIKSTLKQK